MALTEKVKQQLFDVLKAKTIAFSVKNGMVKEVQEDEPKIDPNLQRVANLTRDLGGCSGDEFRELISLLVAFTGKDLPQPEVKNNSEGGLHSVKYAVVTVLANNNNHNYPFGKNAVPIILSNPDMGGSRCKGMTAKLLEGNWLPMEFDKDIKPATEKEIMAFVEEFSKQPTAEAWSTKILTSSK
jgi:hypothetical protein